MESVLIPVIEQKLSQEHIKENENTVRVDDETDIQEAVVKNDEDPTSETSLNEYDVEEAVVPEVENSIPDPVPDELDSDDQAGNILIPLAGSCNDSLTVRRVRNGCAICLCPFDEEAIVSWSSNTCCPHTFHQTCVVDWLMASGRKHLKRLRRLENQDDVPSDPVERVIRFPMLCPCCRQDFVIPEEESSSEEGSLKSIPTDETPPSGSEESSEQ